MSHYELPLIFAIKRKVMKNFVLFVLQEVALALIADWIKALIQKAVCAIKTWLTSN